MSNKVSPGQMALWFAFLAYCVLGMGLGPQMPQTIGTIGSATVRVGDLLLAAALVLGIGPLLTQAGQALPSWTRLSARIVLIYLLYEGLIVLPLAWWFGTNDVASILRQMWVRFLWILFPVMIVVCRSERSQRIAAKAAVVGAAVLVAWGILHLLTGDSGAFLYAGDTRFRVLWGGSTILFAWPFALAVSGALTRRWAVLMSALSLTGLLLANHRSGYLAFAACGLFAVVVSGRLDRAWRWAVPAALALVVIVLATGSWIQVRYAWVLLNLVNPQSNTAADRLTRWSAAWDTLRSAPLGDFVWTGRVYLPSESLASNYLAHNLLMELAQTQGLPGLLFACGVLALAFIAASRWIRRDARIRTLTAYLVAAVVFSLFNTTFSNPLTASFVIAAVAAIAATSDRVAAASRNASPLR